MEKFNDRDRNFQLNWLVIISVSVEQLNLLFSDRLEPKPAYKAIANAFKNAPKRS